MRSTGKESENWAIAFCGLNCVKCDIHEAAHGNAKLMEEIVNWFKKERKEIIKPEQIKCEGCRECRGQTMRMVPRLNLGSTGSEVSKLGFGTFDFGVPSLNISPEKGGRILFESYRLGVNLWDTSDDYCSHPHVASALKHVPRKDVVISTKTGAKSGEEAKKSLRNSLEELNTDYIDIFLLHYVKSDWLDGCRQVLKELNKTKKTGIVKAVGLSTHSVTVAKEASGFQELDVLMTVCCKADQVTINRFRERIPLEDGTMEEMFRAMRAAHDNGKGVIAMKVLGNSAPPFVKDYRSSIKSVAQLDFVDAMVIGMKNLDEVSKNVDVILSS